MDDRPTPEAPDAPEAAQQPTPATAPAPAPAAPSPAQPQQQWIPSGQAAAPPPATAAKERPFMRGFGIGAGVGVGLSLTLGILGLIGSLLSVLMIAGLASSLGTAAKTDTTAVKTIWGKESATRKLRAIPVTGMIMGDASEGAALSAGTYGYEVADMLDKLEAKDADGVVLLLNTPGGSITGSRAMGDAIDRYKKRTGKKVVAYVQGLSASGGMYTMAGADEIIADHGSLVGSIGVISGPFARYKDVKAIGSTILTPGVETTGGITQSYMTQGRGKDMGDPFRDWTEEERTKWNAFMATEYTNFVNWVSERRGIPADTIRNDLGAFIYGTADAKAKKLIDDVMGRDEAFRHFATQAGLDPADTKVVQSEPPSLFQQFLGAEARAYGVAPAATAPAGQQPRATAAICAARANVWAYHGDPAAICG